MRSTVLAFALVTFAAGFAPALARPPLVCLAATNPAEAGTPVERVERLEFYSDEGDPLRAWSKTFTLTQTTIGADGQTENTYRVARGPASGATIVFSGSTPLMFSVVQLGRTYASLEKNAEETAFMADAVPGIACYTVSIEAP